MAESSLGFMVWDDGLGQTKVILEQLWPDETFRQQCIMASYVLGHSSLNSFYNMTQRPQKKGFSLHYLVGLTMYRDLVDIGSYERVTHRTVKDVVREEKTK